MLSALCTGTLVNDPKERTNASGNPYATALLRVACEDGEPMLISVIAFNADAVTAILALQRGDSVAIAGRAKLSEWKANDGTERRGLSVTADRVLSAYAAGKQRKAVREAQDENAGAMT